MMRGSRFTRGLALVLCLCLTVPYLPVPGHAEGCGHVHGEECYREVTQCVHTHGEDCWSDPEAKDAGEEPDACTHVCGEDTGCVTKALNCAHTHDDTCGEQPQEEPEPEPEEPEPEEPKPEEPEEPQEPKDEEPKQEEENQSLVISQWQWVDEEEVLDPETGVLCLSSEEPILFEQVVELLPKAILATVGEGSQTVPLGPWDPKDYPQETGANSGSYQLDATLPEGYTLAEDAAPLTLHLEFAQAQALVDCGHENVNMDTGKCLGCGEQVYEAKIGDTGYATLEEALTDAQKEENEGCTVVMLCDVDPLYSSNPGRSYIITDGIFSLNLNGKQMWGRNDNEDGGFLVIKGASLTIIGSTSSNDTAYICNISEKPFICLKDGEVTIRGGDFWLEEAGIDALGGVLNIEGGSFSGSAEWLFHIAAEASVVFSGGTFKPICGCIVADNGSVADSLADGKAFYYDSECTMLVDASGKELASGLYYYYVGDHKTHTFTDQGNGTYKCACGRVCDHTKANMETGKCLCGQKQLYEAKIGDTGYATLGEALDAAQEDGNKSCTVVMLCDCGYWRDFIITKGVFTLDLNEKRLSMWGSIRVDGGELTVRNGEIRGEQYFALNENGGTLKIESGYFTSEDPLRGGLGLISTIGMTDISGGRFDKIATYSGLSAEIIGYVVDILADGKAIYSKPEGGEENLVDASKTQLSGDLYVLPHTDTYDAKTGKCPCGRCKHNIDMTTGRCSSCQSQVYLAKIGDTGYAKMDAALTAAQRDANKGCTVTMLCNVYSESASYAISGGDFTLDLNGKTVSGIATNPIIEISGGVLKVVNDGCVINKFRSTVKTSPVIKLNAGKLSIAANLTSEANVAIEAAGGTLEITGGELVSSRGPFSLQAASTANVCISGGSFSAGIKSDGRTVIDLIADGYAVYEGDTIVDASVDAISKDISVKEHPTHTYSATTGKCPCGRTIPQATLDTAPAEAKLTYNGQPQNLVTPGTVTGGTLMYSLAENGTYTETVPTGKNADTYTVWYYVLGTPGKYYNTEKKSLTVTVGKKDLTPVVTIQDQDFDGTKEVKHFTVTLEGKEDGDDLTYTLGTLEFDAAIPGTRTASLTGTPELKGKDAGNYNLKVPTGLTGKINATARYLDVTDSLPNADSVTIDGEEYPVTTENGKRYVNPSDTGNLLTVYSFVTGSDAHTSYPEGMKVFAIGRQDTGSTLTEIPEFENLLTYEGCSIRLNGTKGIRMITSIDQAKKKALVSSNLAGYTLVEYGTVITRESTLRGKTLNLQNVQSNNYNYAYSRANKKDPVFKTENGRIQYTNVLVNFQPADYQTDLVLRSYIKLLDASGNEVTLYGGTVTRSIYYIAQQNINDYQPGSAGYKYLMEILNS